MRQLSKMELLSLTEILKLEKDGLIMSKSIKNVISDDDLKKQIDTSITAAEGRIKGFQQFVDENQITSSMEV